MNDEHLNQLISASLDDDLSVEEQAELERLLSESLAARQLHADFQQLEQRLAEAQDIEPPANLQAKIVQQISLPQPPVGGLLTRWLSSIRLQPVLRYGFAAVFGALIAAAIYESQPNFAVSTDITELVGTMAPKNGVDGRQVLDSLTVSAVGMSSVAVLEQRGRALVLDVRLDTNRHVEIQVNLTGAGLRFEALAQTYNALDTIGFSNGVLNVTGQGQSRFAVLLQRSADPAPERSQVHLQYSVDGEILQQGTLSAVQ